MSGDPFSACFGPRLRGRHGVIAAAVMLSLAMTPAVAQDPSRPAKGPPKPAAQAAPPAKGTAKADPKGDGKQGAAAEEPAQPPRATPYDRDLLRLAEVMGSLSFLRTLCKAPDAAEWRTRMNTLLDAEGQPQARRENLAGAFNKGFQNYAVIYRQCTASATEATGRYLIEGESLSRAIASRFGG